MYKILFSQTNSRNNRIALRHFNGAEQNIEDKDIKITPVALEHALTLYCITTDKELEQILK